MDLGDLSEHRIISTRVRDSVTVFRDGEGVPQLGLAARVARTIMALKIATKARKVRDIRNDGVVTDLHLSIATLQFSQQSLVRAEARLRRAIQRETDPQLSNDLESLRAKIRLDAGDAKRLLDPRTATAESVAEFKRLSNARSRDLTA